MARLQNCSVGRVAWVKMRQGGGERLGLIKMLFTVIPPTSPPEMVHTRKTTLIKQVFLENFSVLQ